MTWPELVSSALRLFQFRTPTGQFRPAPARATDVGPMRAEIAYADPRRLFPGTSPWASYNPSVLVGAKGLQIFDEMRRDDQVKAAMAFKKHACIATSWTVSSPEGQPDTWPPTRFTKWVLDNLDPNEIGSTTLDSDLYEMLGALEYGFSATEKIWAPIEDGEWRGHIGLRSLKTRAPHGIVFAQDVYGNLLDDGIIQQVNTTVPAGRMPRSKFLLFSYQSQFGNPYGTSDLEATYFPWWSKYNAQKWLAMLLERYGIPPLFGLYQPNKYTAGNLIDELKRILMNLQASTVGVIPRPDKDALEFWSPPEAGVNAPRVFIPSLDYFNKAIARSILMPDLLGMTSDTSQGSYARSRVHFDVFLLVVERIRRDLQMAINYQIVRPMLDLNFPGLTDYPLWHFMPLTDDLRLELIAQWATLVKDGVVSEQREDEQYVRRMMQMPDLTPDAQRRAPSTLAPDTAKTGAPSGAAPSNAPTAPTGPTKPAAPPRQFANGHDERASDVAGAADGHE